MINPIGAKPFLGFNTFINPVKHTPLTAQLHHNRTILESRAILEPSEPTDAFYFSGRSKKKKTQKTKPVQPTNQVNKGIPVMLQLDTSNVSSAKIGTQHGLDLPAEFSKHATQVASIITNLYQTKDQTGAWKKWLNLGYDTQLLKDIETYTKSVKGEFDDVVILGIGGSSLGGYAMLKALLHPYWNNLTDKQRNGYPRFHFVENVDADQMNGLFSILDPKKTLFNVITKSGTTAETMSAFMLAKEWLEENLSKKGDVKKHIVATTDKTKGILRPIAQQEGYATFEVPDDVGGRFSVFSAVGLLPAALCGIDIAKLQQGIQALDKQLQNPDIQKNPAAQNALIQYLLYQKGKPVSVFMPYSYRLASIADWYVQLWAESLGKKVDKQGNTIHVGPTPLKAVGVTDQHSQIQLYNEGPNDKVVTFVSIGKPDKDITIPNQFNHLEDLSYLNNQPMSRLMNAEFESTRSSLTMNQRPNVTLNLPELTPESFAQLLYFAEVQTAIAGELFNIDPFDQPGVELAKKYTYALMGRKGYENLVDEAKGKVPVKTP